MPNPYKKLLVTCSLAPPNPKCYVCSPKPEVTCLVHMITQNRCDIVLRYLQQANVKLNTNSATVGTLQEKVYMYVATIVHNCWGKSVFIFSIPLCRLFSVVDLTVMCRNGVYMYMYILQILKNHFGMLAPDVDIQDGKGTILISSEEGETDSERADSGFFLGNF